MKTVHLVFTTDGHHTQASRELIGVATTKENAIALIKDYIRAADFDPLSDDDLYNLERINQTQGYDGFMEFVLDEAEVNELYNQ